MDISELKRKVKRFHEHNSTLNLAVKIPVNSGEAEKWFDDLQKLKEDAGKEFAKLTADRNSPGIFNVVTIQFMESFIESVESGRYK